MNVYRLRNKTYKDMVAYSRRGKSMWTARKDVLLVWSAQKRPSCWELVTYDMHESSVEQFDDVVS